MIYILCGFETCGKNEKYNKYCQYIKVCSLHTPGKKTQKKNEGWKECVLYFYYFWCTTIK